jgi:hypothetical protein
MKSIRNFRKYFYTEDEICDYKEIYLEREADMTGSSLYEDCFSKYYELMEQGANSEYIVTKIKTDQDLSPGYYGTDLKRSIIQSLFEDFFSKRKDGLEFLESFLDVDEIKIRYLAHACTKFNYGSEEN